MMVNMHIVLIYGGFNMKKLFFILTLSLSLTNCSTTTSLVRFGELHNIEYEKIKPHVWRELLKEYFLCVCLTEAFKENQIDEKDMSQAVYFDVLPYSPETFLEVKNYAKKFVETIETSPIADLDNKRAVILSCIDKYKSKELDIFVKSMDKYLLKGKKDNR